MSVYLDGVSVLLAGGSVATSGDCCCGGNVCCFTDGTCVVESVEDCLADGGTVRDVTTCEENTCKGGCCNAGVCTIETPDDCQAAGGAFIGYGTDCTGVDCSCCPWFTENMYTQITLSGTITGCPSGTITIPSQTWTLNNVPPGLLSVNEFSLFGCTFSAVSTCLGLSTAIAADEDGTCNNIIGVDWLSLCTNHVQLSALLNTFLCGCAGCSGAPLSTDFYITGPTLSASLPDTGDPSILYNFSISFS